MKSIIALIFCAYLSTAVAKGGHWSIHSFGYGAVRVGMNQRQAEKLLGVKLHLEANPFSGSCFIASPEAGHKGIYFVIEDGVIAYVATATPSIATVDGVSVGSAASKVHAQYPSRVETETDRYDERVVHLFVWERDRKHGLKFAISSEGAITEIRGGNSTINSEEGPCS